MEELKALESAYVLGLVDESEIAEEGIFSKLKDKVIAMKGEHDKKKWEKVKAKRAAAAKRLSEDEFKETWLPRVKQAVTEIDKIMKEASKSAAFSVKFNKVASVKGYNYADMILIPVFEYTVSTEDAAIINADLGKVVPKAREVANGYSMGLEFMVGDQGGRKVILIIHGSRVDSFGEMDFNY